MLGLVGDSLDQYNILSDNNCRYIFLQYRLNHVHFASTKINIILFSNLYTEIV